MLTRIAYIIAVHRQQHAPQAEMVTSTSTPGSKLMLVWSSRMRRGLLEDWEGTYDLLDNLAGGVQVDEALVDLELVAVPGLRTFTARLETKKSMLVLGVQRKNRTYRLASGDLKALGREADGALHAELLVLCAVDEIRRDCSFSIRLSIAHMMVATYTSPGS